MRARKLTTEVRRDQIARAALQLIAARGVRGLSLETLAKKVGIVPSGIYRHFRGREEVLDATLEHLGARLHHNLDLVAAETEDPLERIHRLLIRHVRLIRENQAIPRIIFSEEVYGRHSARKARVRAIIGRYLEGVAGFVREGQAAGRIRRDLDARAAAVAFLGLFQPAAILWHLSDGDFPVTRQTEQAWRIYRAGIEKRPAPRRVAP
ncbi:MAG: TetR/AcrR family transcriptional regulator [Bacteroidota bacterium]